MQKGRHAVTDCAITPADAIGEAFCEERERLGLAKALTTDVGRVGLNCIDYELTCQKVGRKGAPAARRTPWSQHIGPGRVWWHRSKLARIREGPPQHGGARKDAGRKSRRSDDA